jgi:hypothetical protein
MFKITTTAITLSILLSNVAFAQTTLQVLTIDGAVRDVDLTALPRHEVAAQERGLKRLIAGVLLRDVLQQAGVEFGEAIRGPVLRRYVVVVGKDGYKAVYALAELDEVFTDDAVVLADRMDGNPLIFDHGPLRAIAPADKRGDRRVRQVIRVEVRDAP